MDGLIQGRKEDREEMQRYKGTIILYRKGIFQNYVRAEDLPWNGTLIHQRSSVSEITPHIAVTSLWTVKYWTELPRPPPKYSKRSIVDCSRCFMVQRMVDIMNIRADVQLD